MKLRWILPPLAVLTLGLILWIAFHGETRTGASMLASARERLASAPRDPGDALRELDEALRLARGQPDRALCVEILRVR